MRTISKCLFVFIFFLRQAAFAQNTAPRDSIVDKVNAYGIRTAAPALFVHCDKVIYLPNETIWFTAYLLDARDLLSHTTLSVSLVCNKTKAITLHKKFVMSDGIAAGDISLPETIAPGNYTLLAHTNILKDGKPLAVALRQIIVKGMALGSTLRPTMQIASLPAIAAPAVQQAGISIKMEKSVVNDTLVLNLNAGQPKTVYLLVHDLKQVYFFTPVQVNASGLKMKLPLATVPKGLIALTILDDAQKVIAEQIAFVHFDKQSTIAVTADNETYAPRQKVTLHLSLGGTDSASKALVSVACVKENRLALPGLNNIERYYYVNNKLQDLPTFKDVGENSAYKTYLEYALPASNWRGYSWPEVMRTNDTIPQGEDMIVEGRVTDLWGKPIKRQVSLSLFADSNLTLISPDKNGRFTIPTQNMVTAIGSKQPSLLVNGNDGFFSKINMHDPFIDVSRKLADSLHFEDVAVQPDQLRELNQEDLVGQVKLKEVNIKTRVIEDPYNRGVSIGHPNECGDYVCVAGAINCPLPGHTWRIYPPVKGKRYARHVIVSGRVVQNVMFIYQGCEVSKNKAIYLDGINVGLENFPADTTAMPAATPTYLSTLYWNGRLELSRDKTTDISFYTSDLTGVYRIIIQGITDTGVVYGEREIEVK